MDKHLLFVCIWVVLCRSRFCDHPIPRHILQNICKYGSETRKTGGFWWQWSIAPYKKKKKNKHDFTVQNRHLYFKLTLQYALLSPHRQKQYHLHDFVEEMKFSQSWRKPKCRFSRRDISPPPPQFNTAQIFRKFVSITRNFQTLRRKKSLVP